MLLLVLAASSTATMFTTILNLLGGCTLVCVLGFWISLVVWVWRDTHARTTDRRFQRIFTLLVALLQRIDEESRLSELAERRTCPTCQTYLTDEFQVCPTFGNVLRRPCPRGPRLLNLQWQFCHRSRPDARGARAWSCSFPSAPALDLDWKHHLNRKGRVYEERGGALDSWVAETCVKEAAVSIAPPVLCSWNQETPKNIKQRRSQKP